MHRLNAFPDPFLVLPASHVEWKLKLLGHSAYLRGFWGVLLLFSETFLCYSIAGTTCADGICWNPGNYGLTPPKVQASTPLSRFGRKVHKSGRTLVLSGNVPPPWLLQKVEKPNSSKWINAAALASSDICGAQQPSSWEFHERRRMSQQSSLWCGRLWGGWADVRIFLPPFHFHSQTGLNFPHPYCHMMTYFDDLNPKGKTKMTAKKMEIFILECLDLKLLHHREQTWCMWDILDCCFFYYSGFLRSVLAQMLREALPEET